MAVAWALSIYFIKLPGAVMPYLEHNHLDDWTYNKALQKITESFRVDQETKTIIRSMKRPLGLSLIHIYAAFHIRLNPRRRKGRD